MKNPNQLAKDLPKWKWIMATHKLQVIFLSLFIIAVEVWSIIMTYELWYVWTLILPAWAVLHVYRLTSLYNKNLKSYHNWEETYGGKLKN